MKIQCNVCEVAEAKVLCCADEAALCLACDVKIHTANKLASKHQRIPLCSSSSQIPKCDICQDAAGFFFCLEDRALLCRKCDVAIHTVNTFVSAHQRFLLTGVKVGFEHNVLDSSSSTAKSPSGEKISETFSSCVSVKGLQRPMVSEGREDLPVHVRGVGDFIPANVSFSGGSAAGSIPQWHVDDIFNLTDFNQHYGYMDNYSSKDDSGNYGESDFSPILRTVEEEIDDDDDECLGQVPETYPVPQIPSPLTASGLYLPKYSQNLSGNTLFVPDICDTLVQNPHYQYNATTSKRRRQF